MRKFVFFYFMKAMPEAIGKLASQHAAYWRSLALSGYQGGPFADRSGGMIIFSARDMGQAKRLAGGDPFVKGRVMSQNWLKEWEEK